MMFFRVLTIAVLMSMIGGAAPPLSATAPAMFSPAPVSGGIESCDTDCHDQCRFRTDFPPIEFIEPTCHAKCEIAKKAACAINQPLPTIPVTPFEQGKTAGNAVCGAVFHTITQAVIAQCSNYDGRLDGQQQIENAKATLLRAGLFQPGEFNGVQIRQCPAFTGEGIAPEQGRIYLKPEQINGSHQYLTSLLGHEMIHIRQHRARDSSAFACDYSRAYTACGGCQDSRNWLEREAFDWQAANAQRIANAVTFPPPVQYPMPQPIARVCVVNPMPGGQCPMGIAVPVGSQCTCTGPYGVFWGIAQ